MSTIALCAYSASGFNVAWQHRPKALFYALGIRVLQQSFDIGGQLITLSKARVPNILVRQLMQGINYLI